MSDRQKLNLSKTLLFFTALKDITKYYGQAHVIHHIQLHLRGKEKIV